MPNINAPASVSVPFQRPPLQRQRQSFLQRYATSEDGAAAEHAECPITFEPLHSGAVGVFVGADGRRVSQHFYSLEAGQAHLEAGNRSCPLTRRAITDIIRVPDVTRDPHGWFRIVDEDGNGRLSKKEVVEALKAQMNVDYRRLDRELDDPQSQFNSYWRQWDRDGSGSVEPNEVSQIAAVMKNQYASKVRDGAPDIRQSKSAWYQYWDEDDNGTLQKDEVLRALVKTFNARHELSQVEAIRSALEVIWPLFDNDGDGSIDRGEFLRQGDGLADTIIAQLAHI